MEGDSASSVSASTLASLRDDFGEDDLADEHPLERLIDALYEKRCAAALVHAPSSEQQSAQPRACLHLQQSSRAKHKQCPGAAQAC